DFRPAAARERGTPPQQKMDPMLGYTRYSAAIEHVGPRRVARVTEVRIGPARGQVESRNDLEVGAELHPAVARPPGVLVVDARSRGKLVWYQLVADACLEQGERVIEAANHVAPRADLNYSLAL